MSVKIDIMVAYLLAWLGRKIDKQSQHLKGKMIATLLPLKIKAADNYFMNTWNVDD
jgi:hypothetical protein